MVWQAIAGAVLKEGSKGGAGALAPVVSGGGDLDFDFGGFGGVNFASKSDQTVLYVALAAVALIVVLMVLKR